MYTYPYYVKEKENIIKNSHGILRDELNFTEMSWLFVL